MKVLEDCDRERESLAILIHQEVLFVVSIMVPDLSNKAPWNRLEMH